MTKLFALGAIGAGLVAAVRAAKQRSLQSRQQRNLESEFDVADLDAPVVVTEEVIVVTEMEPFEGVEQPREGQARSTDVPTRGAGPR